MEKLFTIKIIEKESSKTVTFCDVPESIKNRGVDRFFTGQPFGFMNKDENLRVMFNADAVFCIKEEVQ